MNIWEVHLNKVVYTLLQFQWFQIEVLQAMEKKVKLDEEYIQVRLKN